MDKNSSYKLRCAALVLEGKTTKVNSSRWYDIRKNYIAMHMEFDLVNAKIVDYGMQFDNLVKVS